MTVRKCSTCKHYEPAPIWRKGWCRNPLLYSPQQSHLVGEDDLDCDRGMGNYWEPIDQPGVQGTGPVGRDYDQAGTQAGAAYDQSGGIAPVHLRGHHEAYEAERRGGDVSQYGGPGRPTGSDEYGSGGGSGHGGDDDRYTQPFAEQRGPDDPYDEERTPFGYQPEERYWTDYLRIAAPVVGVILMLGLVWFWVANMIGGNDNDDAVNDDVETSGPVIPAETPEATDDEADDTDDPIAVTTPAEEEDEENAENGENGEAEPTTIGPGATVVVVGTGESGLNMRSAASTEAEILGSFPDGTTLTVTGESQEADGFTWWPVEVEGQNGFVAADFLELSTETEE
jgi:hypothetical protein